MDTDYDTQVDIPELDDSPDPDEPCNPETPYEPYGPICDNQIYMKKLYKTNYIIIFIEYSFIISYVFVTNGLPEVIKVMEKFI